MEETENHDEDAMNFMLRSVQMTTSALSASDSLTFTTLKVLDRWKEERVGVHPRIQE
jgi:hypothetical protein